MGNISRTEAQRAASRRNGARSAGPRSSEGRIRSSANAIVHGLNSVRLLLPTEQESEYRQHLEEWVRSLAPASPAEHQIVQLVADLMWRLKRIERIEQRRAAAVLDEMVELTPEASTRAQVKDLALALDTVERMVGTSAVPVPTSVMAGFVAGVRGVEQMVEALRASLSPEAWPEAAVCLFLRAVMKLVDEVEAEASVSESFTVVGSASAALATALRALEPSLQAAVDKARAALSTNTLLVDDEDRRFERHRRILEASMARQLDLLAKVRAACPAASGSFERAPQVELRLVRV